MRLGLATIIAGTVGVAATLASGCTFGGLANYTIATCDPAQPQATDECNRLNTDPTTCTPFQCDPATRHCVQKARDDDRDGDPSIACGGTDCDDNNPARSGKAREICDRLDNNCNGLVDEDVVTAGTERVIAPTGALASTSDPILAPSDDARRSGLAAFVSGTCIPFVTLEPGAGAPVGACTIPDLNNAPRQPYPLRLSTGNAAAFVPTGACPGGRLAYRARTNASVDLEMACDAAHPAALPAIAANPSSANASSGLIAWYEARVGDRLDPVGGCATIQPASFALLRVPTLTAPPASPAQGDVLIAAEKSTATRPPSLLPIETAGGMLVATPLGDDVGVWLLTPKDLVGTVLPAPTHVPLTGARAVSTAMRVVGDKVQVALAAEIGCRPSASIRLALGTLDPANGALAFGAPIDIAPPSEIATDPSVAWVAGREEWWVGWIGTAAHARVQRLSADGKPIGASLDLGKALPLARVSGAETVFAVDPAESGGSFVEIPIGCGSVGPAKP